MKMNIIYLHGFNSDGNGGTASKLKEVYGNLLLSPSYDYANPDKAFKSINKFLLENANKNSVLVGTSLGGFWANYFAQKYHLPVVLVNPSLTPSSTTKKYIGENKNFSSGKIVRFTKENAEAFKKYQVKIDKNIERTTILSIKDDVIDYKTSEKLLKETKVIYDKKQGHRLEDIDKVVLAIDKSFQNYIKILTEKVLLTERVVNLFPNDVKEKQYYGPTVFSMLQNSYAKVGGLQGNGFSSVEDMIRNIPMWKLVKSDGKIVCAIMYKDKAGRKRVAGGTDGSVEGKKAFLQVSGDELKTDRSYGEISGPSLAFQKNNLASIHAHAIPFDEVASVLNKEIRRPPADDAEVLKYPILKDFFYQRVIGGEWHTKLLIGKTGNKIT